uniref:Transglycosylase SLT domain-containing protein n=1 Tax=Lotharella oceanica TaxID=641309 RepID=A0A7S2TMW4_9EUKA|mmetsp:Transcript_19815/g.37251  ORF Transcript_19815/g.37251 Transcript_19815/m.37251 type:complete len:148 (+) Transcript_19815:53-496(+)|eukprot:CAMPEP_0170169520 /NCGR_PEP_ID=MMETSP0040_2-20121228/2441_1 /TAXON_ID=641309 /ORGANISM="Lotharella oceanica, Strain CCMP622" /LENGTH=147 /DNA_ID=CAMNT_0010408317 /DNA_START=56 /DNA_END=499 /DNA_ORIENTATION=-
MNATKMLLIALLVPALMAININVNSTSTTCGGNCPGGCSDCPCGTSSSSQSISSWCSKYSGWKQSSCECIMSHESRGNANAVNQNFGGSYDVGLWQINSANWGSCSGGKAPCDPSTNLNCAKKVFAWGGNTWKLWSTCSICGVCGSS